MVRVIFIGVGAGVAAALLFVAPAGGSALALPLFLLTGLPIAIAGLGWGLAGGAAAALAGGVVVGLFLPAPAAVLIFMALFGAPIVWLARLAGLWRETEAGAPRPARQWFPLGRLLLHATVAVAIGLVVAGFFAGYDPEAMAREASAALVEFLSAMQTADTPPTAEALQAFVRFYVALLPFTTSMFLVGVIVFNLWLGARVARASGRLARPAERLSAVTPPNEILIGFAVAVVLAFLPGVLGDVALVFAGAFGCALALVGLAVLHALTLGMSGRGVILGIVYALILVSGLPLVLLAILGAGESFLHLRARRFGGAPPPP